MKRILITGANSYVGMSLEKWLQYWVDDYLVDTIDTIGDEWKSKSFANYNVVFHVAGIAHIKEKKKDIDLYYKVNRDLVYEVAKKAKAESVEQFIFISSISVYGIDIGVIDKNSPLNPKNIYGKSKLQAESLITPLEDDTFKIAILRPPMIYGKGCKGNYPRLAKVAQRLPFFPNLQNKRSMLYIDNLCEFVRLLIEDRANGLFFPQNTEYVCTAYMVKLIAEAHGKRLLMISLFNPLIRVLKFRIIKKVYGNLVYDKNLSSYTGYNAISIEASIKKTET